MYYKIPIYSPISVTDTKLVVILSLGLSISALTGSYIIYKLRSIERDIKEIKQSIHKIKSHNIEIQTSDISNKFLSQETQTSQLAIALTSCCKQLNCVCISDTKSPIHYKATTDISSRIIKDGFIR